MNWKIILIKLSLVATIKLFKKILLSYIKYEIPLKMSRLYTKVIYILLNCGIIILAIYKLALAFKTFTLDSALWKCYEYI